MSTPIQKVKIALGRSAFSNQIVSKTLSIRKLYKSFEEPAKREKKDGPYFVFAELTGGKRNAKAVQKYYGATLDFDDTDLTVKEIKAIYKKWSNCLYSTHSHKARLKNKKGEMVYKGNRYRVVIPYKEPVSTDKHRTAIVSLMAMFDAEGVDVSAKALSIPVYLPAVPSKTADKYIYHVNKTSNLFDALDIQLDGEAKWKAEQLMETVNAKVDITENVKDGGRNDTMARYAGKFIQDGMTLEDVLASCLALNVVKFSPPSDESEVKTTVESVWASHVRNNGDTQWSGEQILSSIKKQKTIDIGALRQFMEMMVLAKKRKKMSSLEEGAILRTMKSVSKEYALSDIKKEYAGISKDVANGDTTIYTGEEEGQEQRIEELTEEFQDFFFIKTEDRIYNFATQLTYKTPAFDRTYSFLSSGPQGQSASRLLQTIKALQFVDAKAFHPGKDRVFKNQRGAQFLNLYSPLNLKAKQGRVLPLLRHFEYLFPNEYEREIVLSWIAIQVQQPGTKLTWMPVIKGGKGVGKSLISNVLLSTILGEHNIRSLGNTEQITGRFNAWQTGKQIVVVHELRASTILAKRQELTENIKSFLSENIVTVERKGLDQEEYANLTNMMAFTNHEDCLYITPDERRFCMLRVEADKKSPEYYKHLVDFIKGNARSILYYFAERDITIDPNDLPVTAYTRELIQSSFNPEEEAMLDVMKERDNIIKQHKFLTWTSLCKYIALRKRILNIGNEHDQEIPGRNSAQGRKLKDALLSHGFSIYGNPEDRFAIQGKRDSIFCRVYSYRGLKEDEAIRQATIASKDLNYFFDHLGE